MANELDIKIKAKFVPCPEGYDYHFCITVGDMIGDLYVTGSTPWEDVGGQIIGRIISLLSHQSKIICDLITPPSS